MASSIALRKAAGGTTTLFTRLSNHAKVAPSTFRSRSFNTGTQMTTVNGDDQAVDANRSGSSVSRRRNGSIPALFSDAFDPFFPTRNLSQMLNMMDQLMDSPILSGSRGSGSGIRRGWDVKEMNDALCFRVDMPGLDKNQVKVSMEQNTLVIKGEGEKESEGDEYGRRYSSRVDLSPKLYKIDGIKAEMKNGVLKVVVPKLKEEERKDVHEVSIE